MDNKSIAKEIRSSIKKGDSDKVVGLIGTNTELLNMMTPFGTWLHVAASRGELGIVKNLVELGLDVNVQGGVYEGGALNEAASAGQMDIVGYLLSCGAKMDVSNPEKNPLFGAISNGHVEIARLLIERGINIDAAYHTESDGNLNATTFAKEQGQKEIAGILMSYKEESTESTESYGYNQEHHEEILNHVTECLSPVQSTIKEIIPGSSVSIDIHVIPATKEKNFTTLVTTGMSDEPMDYSDKEGTVKYAELLLKLPSDWLVEEENMKDPSNNWPLVWLRKAAHIPHTYDGWLEEGVIFPNGEPPQTFAANTSLSCIMVCRTQEAKLCDFQTKQGNIHFYTLVPIYKEEREIALEKGYQYLIEKMNEKGISDVLDIDRLNVGI